MIIAKTMQEYLNNPMGSGSTAMTNRTLIKKDLDSRYDKLIEKHKEFKISVYRIKGHDAYFFHVIIPSETRIDGSYDVVLKLYPEDKDIARDSNIKRYVMQVFSNCPSFTYTYAYVFNEYNLLIDILRVKYGKEIIKDNPVVRNPGEVINFEKSIYYACKNIMSHATYTSKVTLEPRVKTVSKEDFINNIRDIDTIAAEIKKENERLKLIKEKKKDDLAHLKTSKDYTKEKDMDKLRVDQDNVKSSNMKKVTYYRRQKLKPIKKVKAKPKIT